MSLPLLSVVIPAFNEAARLPSSLRRIRDYLEAEHYAYEIVVVDDGSTDGTAEAAEAALGSRVTVVRNDGNRGKGFSVRRGMLLARGNRRLMTDADLSAPIEELPRLWTRLDEGFDIAIGSRALPDSVIDVHQSFFREGMGRIFNRLVRLLAVPGLKDTQCGFKLFSAEAATEAFGAGRLDGFSFDVEALFIARRRGRRIAEVPVRWSNDTATRVTLSRGLFAFLDLLRIRTNAWAGRYGL